MWRLVAVVAILMLVCAPAHAQSPSGGSGGLVVWTAVGAGAGFGAGLWAGLIAFDDAVNSERKVWTSAVVGAAVGGMTGYLIGRARRDRTRPPTATRLSPRDWSTDVTLVREVARSVRLGCAAPIAGSSFDRMRSTP